MKKGLKTFFNNPPAVTLVSLCVALGIGAYSYRSIHAPVEAYIPIEQSSVALPVVSEPSQVTLGFLSGGRIRSVSVKTGDTVKKGQVLATLEAGNALGLVSQAKAAYALAQANYEKVINGATGATIDVAKSSVHTAEVNLEQIKKQQDVLVLNARKNYLNSTIVAKPVGDSMITPPTISGAYTKDTEGTITIRTNQGGAEWGYLTFSGLLEGTGELSANTPKPISNTGLYIQFPAVASYGNTSWTITIPNMTAPNYLANYNAYQSALQTKDQAIATAQSVLDQARASLTALVAQARPEDVKTAQAQVENAKGALEVAEASYRNNVITAPISGTITAVNIAVGQIAIANAAAIEITHDTLPH